MSVIQHLGKWKQQDQKLKVILRYELGLRLAWGIWDLLSEKKEGDR